MEGIRRPLESEIERSIEVAARQAGVGLELPAMTQVRGWRRLLVTPLARLVLRLGQVITHGQRAYNAAIVDTLRPAAARLRRHESKLEAMERRLTTQAALVDQELRLLRAELMSAADAVRAEQVERLDGSLSAVQRELAGLQGTMKAHRQELTALHEVAIPRLDDAVYAEFEKEFRGERADIKSRSRGFLDTLRSARGGEPGRPIVDLGCGRGELLEVLQEEGLSARGVDLSQAAVEACRERSLDVVQGELVAYLTALPDSSVGAVTAIHVLEHLPLAILVKVLQHSFRVLKPGGVAIFESPNPQNLWVGACSFYLDPTHRNPLHPFALRFLAKAQGFDRVEVQFLHPVERPASEVGAPDDLFRQCIYGPQDFAVLAHRA